MLQATLIGAGSVFFALGTLGLFRLPDTSTRIHALTKVDNLGLGLVVIGLLPEAQSLTAGAKIVLIWIVALAASATAAHLVSRSVAPSTNEPHDD
jgi:multicomponent Na+:H+ antiporter subunit G